MISTLCQTGSGKWLKCPDQANVRPSSGREFMDNINSEPEEQKFCCGNPENRFCCSFSEKLTEIPGFDPENHKDASGMRYRFHRPSFWSFWSYAFMFFLTVFFIGVLFWIFGFVLFEVRSAFGTFAFRIGCVTTELSEEAKRQKIWNFSISLIAKKR